MKKLVTILLIIAAAGAGVYFYQDDINIDIFEEDSIPMVDEKTLTEGVNKYTIRNMDVYDINEFIPVFDTIESPYIWFRAAEMSDDHYADGISHEEFESRLAKASIMSGLLRYKKISEMCDYAETAIQQLTKKDGNVGIAMFKTYISYNGDAKITALNGANVQPRGETLTSDEHYKKMGLSLDVKNAETKSLLVWSSPDSEYYALVEADVTCKRNDGDFVNLEWIPKEKETNKVTFIINFYSVNNIKNVCIRDFTIYSYEPLVEE